MKNKSTVKKMWYALLASAILLIVAVFAYGIGCYPLYINEKTKVMHQLYDELKDACPLKEEITEGGFDLMIMRELTGGQVIVNGDAKASADILERIIEDKRKTLNI